MRFLLIRLLSVLIIVEQKSWLWSERKLLPIPKIVINPNIVLAVVNASWFGRDFTCKCFVKSSYVVKIHLFPLSVNIRGPNVKWAATDSCYFYWCLPRFMIYFADLTGLYEIINAVLRVCPFKIFFYALIRTYTIRLSRNQRSMILFQNSLTFFITLGLIFWIINKPYIDPRFLKYERSEFVWHVLFNIMVTFNRIL